VVVTVIIRSTVRFGNLLVVGRFYTRWSGDSLGACTQRCPPTRNGSWPLHRRCSPSLEWLSFHWISCWKCCHIGGSCTSWGISRGMDADGSPEGRLKLGCERRKRTTVLGSKFGCRSYSFGSVPWWVQREKLHAEKDNATAPWRDPFNLPLSLAVGMAVRSVCVSDV
jgi:hypothetical protein